MAALWLIPGLYDSGPEHWVATVERALDDSDDPIVLAGHSTGCATIAFWAAATRHAARVRLALLVGPSDSEAPSYPAGPVGFAPMPLARRHINAASGHGPWPEGYALVERSLL
jgi:predicted alpha/beta hydrolase family esterase